MAKKRKKAGTRRRSRRGLGAVSGNAMNAAAIIAGAVAGRLVAKKLLPAVDDKIKNAGVIVLGAFLVPKFIKGAMGKAFGDGMIAAGGAGLVGSFVPGLAGIDDTIDFPVSVGEIGDDISVIAGGDEVLAGAGDNISVLAGMGEEEY